MSKFIINDEVVIIATNQTAKVKGFITEKNGFGYVKKNIEKIICIWYEGTEPKEDYFFEEQIKKVHKPNIKIGKNISHNMY